jgi:8-oxo-dGTP pyrophosphatase MutT (NUDIX family)
MPGPWKKLSAERLATYKIFALERERYVSPRTGAELNATILAAPDWVNIVGITREGDFVMIRQFRFGSELMTIEIPGGMIDAGEEPLLAAKRELREETGYVAERWTRLGRFAPNPAFQRNYLHTFLAEGCVREGELVQDPGEDIEVLLMPERDVTAALVDGSIDHALVVIAFHALELHRRTRTD